MALVPALLLAVLLALLTLAAYIDRVYSEMGRFLARQYQEHIDIWAERVEPALRLSRENIQQSAAILRQLSLAAIALGLGIHLASPVSWTELTRTLLELVFLILVFDRLLPQLLFSRTRGLWALRLRWLIAAVFYLLLPVTLLLGLLLSILALAEPETSEEPEHPAAAATAAATAGIDALLEAGEDEGILEESDRELVRSAVEFGDKIVREVMTPRPEIFAVPATLTLAEFTAALEEHAFSRVPVFRASLDDISGIAFAHDLLQVTDTDAAILRIEQMQRPAAFVPETKRVASLLREMQSEKQHMRLVIDEYGAVAGLVTIEDLLEAIVGEISDEHDEPEDDEEPVAEPGGTWIVPGSFELSRLRDLFEEELDRREAESAAHGTGAPEADAETESPVNEAALNRLAAQSESTTVGGLVTEIAGHIPLPGEVVVRDGLRLEVLASTDRLIERVRLSLES